MKRSEDIEGEIRSVCRSELTPGWSRGTYVRIRENQVRGILVVNTTKTLLFVY